MVVAGLAATVYVNFQEWQHVGPVGRSGIDMSHMMRVDRFCVAFNAIWRFAAALILIVSADVYKIE